MAKAGNKIRSTCTADAAYLEIGSYLGATLVLTFLDPSAQQVAPLTERYRVCIKLVALGLLDAADWPMDS